MTNHAHFHALRSALHGPRDRSGWGAVQAAMRAIRRGTPERVAEAATYARGPLRRWPAELCVAAPGELARLARGDDTTAIGRAHTLTAQLDQLGADPATQARTLLDNIDLWLTRYIHLTIGALPEAYSDTHSALGLEGGGLLDALCAAIARATVRPHTRTLALCPHTYLLGEDTLSSDALLAMLRSEPLGALEELALDMLPSEAMCALFETLPTAHWPRLRTLTIGGGLGNLTGVVDALLRWDGAQHLHTVEVDNVSFHAARHTPTVTTPLLRHPMQQMRALTLGGVRDGGHAKALAGAPWFGQLEELRLGPGWVHNAQDVASICAGWAHTTGPRVLELHGPVLEPAAARVLAAQSFTCLHTLRVDHTSAPTMWPQLSNAPWWPQLTNLHLRVDAHTTPEHLAALLHPTPAPALHSLDLVVDAPGALDHVEALASCGGLRRLQAVSLHGVLRAQHAHRLSVLHWDTVRTLHLHRLCAETPSASLHALLDHLRTGRLGALHTPKQRTADLIALLHHPALSHVHTLYLCALTHTAAATTALRRLLDDPQALCALRTLYTERRADHDHPLPRALRVRHDLL